MSALGDRLFAGVQAMVQTQQALQRAGGAPLAAFALANAADPAERQAARDALSRALTEADPFERTLAHAGLPRFRRPAPDARGERLRRVEHDMQRAAALADDATRADIACASLLLAAQELCEQLDALTIPEARPFERGALPRAEHEMRFGPTAVRVEFECEGGYWYAQRAWIAGAWVDCEDHFAPCIVADWNEAVERLERDEAARVVLGHQIDAVEEARS